MKVPVGNVNALVGEVIAILGNRDLLRNLGNRGRKLAQEHTWDKVADFILCEVEKSS